MRRALVSMVPSGAPPFTMGDTPAAGSISAAGSIHVNADNPAPRAGTVTSVSVYAGSTGSLTVFTGSLSGTTFTVHAAADITIAATGVTTLGVSLAVSPGDFIGFWRPSSGGAAGEYVTGSGAAYTVSSSTKPAGGGTYTVTSAARNVSIQGTGS